MARSGAMILSLAALLAACGQGGQPTMEAAPAGQTSRLIGAGLEAPEVFQITEEGLWDGRPSLGGVWVAHPDVIDPERVIIRNEDTGESVVGALFRRERDNPGPALQVSSDAAEALAMLAGAPATPNVTALRREEESSVEAAAPGNDPAAAAEPAAPSADIAALAPQAVATSSLDAAPPTSPSMATASLADQTAAGLTIDADPPTVATGPIDPAMVDAVARTTAAILASSSGAPTSITASVPTQVASDLDQQFIQLGIFSIEANADDTVSDMEAAGLPARVVASTIQGVPNWRVLVGPATTEAERTTFLERVQVEGFPDAYAVRN